MTSKVSPVAGATAPAGDPLRRLLAQRLRKDRWGKLCEGEAEDYSRGAELMSIGFFMAALLGLVAFAVQRFGWPLWGGLGALALVMVSAAVIGLLTKQLMAIYLVIVAAWAVAGVAQLVGTGLGALASSHVLAVVIVVAALSAARAGQLVADVPIVLPVAFGLVALPLVTEDPWVVAQAAGGRIALFAGLTITPLLAVVLVRQLRLPVAPAFRAAAARLSEASDGPDRALKLLGRLNREDAGLDDERAHRRLRRAYEEPFPAERAPEIAATIGRRFRWQVASRLISLTFGTAASVAAVTYVLAWALIPAPLAAGWTGLRTIPTWQPDLLVIDPAFPLGPYVAVALLLGVVATSGFLAFALTEARYSTAISDALLHKPAERCLLLALALASIREGSGRGRGGRRSRRRAGAASNGVSKAPAG